MKLKLFVFLYLAVIIFIMGTNSLSQNKNNYNVQLEEAIASLDRLLDLLLKPQSVVGDMIFGIVLSAAHLSILKKNILERDLKNEVATIDVISTLEQKCKEIYKKYMPVRITSDRDDYNTIMDNIVNQDLWELDKPIIEGKLQKPSESYKHENSKKLSQFNDSAFLMMGTPQELQSDECIGHLVKPVKCGMSMKCKYIMGNNAETHGYPLTHRLLYYLVAERLGCENNTKFSGLQETITDLCSNILLDLYHVVENGLPSELRDLFLEQISLCGLEGFAEFLNPNYIDWAVHQQMPSGCFTQFREQIMKIQSATQKEHRRVKRDDGQLGKQGCTMHVTGMAAIYLTMNIRAIVEYWNLKSAQTMYKMK